MKNKKYNNIILQKELKENLENIKKDLNDLEMYYLNEKIKRINNLLASCIFAILTLSFASICLIIKLIILMKGG